MYIQTETEKKIKKYCINKYAVNIYNYTQDHHDKIKQFCDYMDFVYIRSERKIITDKKETLYINVIKNEVKNTEIIRADNYYINKSFNINKVIILADYLKKTFHKNISTAKYSFNYLVN
jgi:hypothetical protein